METRDYIEEELEDIFSDFNVNYEIIEINEENQTCLVEFTLNTHEDDEYMGIIQY